jgi:hypothetical protein
MEIMERCRKCGKNIKDFIKCNKCSSIYCNDCCTRQCPNCRCSSLIKYPQQSLNLNFDDLTTKNIFIEENQIIKEKNDENTIKINNENQLKPGKIICISKPRHCNKNYLKCSCCNNKLCSENRCYCYDCMEKNIKKLKLKNILINKKGNIAMKENNGKIIYCCKYPFNSKICTSDNICPDCLDLNNNLNIYKNLIEN